MVLDDISETAWKWRCKISNAIKSHDRTLADFSTQPPPLGSSDSDTSDEKAHRSFGKASAAQAKDPGPGATASIKTFYESSDSSPGNYTWVDYPPRQMSKSDAKAQKRVAIRAYKIRDTSKPTISGYSPLKYHMLQIQNPQLIAALNDAMKDQELNLDVNDTATFEAPFQSLFFGYDKIVAKSRSLPGSDAVQPFLQLLIRLLDEVFSETRAKLEHLQSKKLATYPLAWAYFRPGTTVVAYSNGEALLRVIGTSYTCTDEGEAMDINGEAVNFDGEHFVWEKCSLRIPKFRGSKRLVDLGKYPLEFHEDPSGVMERLTARGRKALDLQGLTHCNYTGMAITETGERHNVDCRILVDVVGFNKHQRVRGPRDSNPRKKIISKSAGAGPEGENPSMVNISNRQRLLKRLLDSNNAGSSDPETGGMAKVVKQRHLTEEEQAANKQTMLAHEQDLMFVVPVIEGYALKNKLWLAFFIEDIRPVSWNDQAYDHLVYEEQQKDLVLSFVESHGAQRPAIEDVIIGKGEGLIVLLSGPPGTGKTLMAEAVADRAHRPLFYLQAEDLGISAATLGANIKKVFGMATDWNAVILLDEADVFMAKREPNDIVRNELVSIFLRELEYFRGIIFLTTNLFSTIDHAFRSRVSLHLRFPPLTAEARAMVWGKFLQRVAAGPAAAGEAGEGGAVRAGAAKSAVEEEDIRELATWQLNGREIKNAVKMVNTWCHEKGYVMDLVRLENGIKVTTPHATKQGKESDTSLYDE